MVVQAGFLLSKMTYSEKLKDPRWQRKRLEIMERDGFMCRNCGDTEASLHVHHVNYQKGMDPWDYENGQLVTFCEPCHEQIEREIRNFRIHAALTPHKAAMGVMCDSLELREKVSALVDIGMVLASRREITEAQRKGRAE